jgi:hypothetical protein
VIRDQLFSTVSEVLQRFHRAIKAFVRVALEEFELNSHLINITAPKVINRIEPSLTTNFQNVIMSATSPYQALAVNPIVKS